MTHLEKVLRCVDNDTIAPDELEDAKNELDGALVRGRCGRAGGWAGYNIIMFP